MNGMRRWTLALALVALALGPAGCGGGGKTTSEPSSSATTGGATEGTVGVTMKEFTVDPSPATAPAGKVTFDVRNDGQQKHEFVVVRTKKRAGELLKGAEADETGNVGEIGDLPPGSAKTLRLQLKAGHYALLCNLPGHYKAGQHADFDVR